MFTSKEVMALIGYTDGFPMMPNIKQPLSYPVDRGQPSGVAKAKREKRKRLNRKR